MNKTFLSVDDNISTYLVSEAPRPRMWSYTSGESSENIDKTLIYVEQRPLQPPYDQLRDEALANVQEEIEEENKSFFTKVKEVFRSKDKKDRIKKAKSLLSENKNFIKNFAIGCVPLAAFAFIMPHFVFSLPLFVLLGAPLIPLAYAFLEQNASTITLYETRIDKYYQKEGKPYSVLTSERVSKEQERLLQNWLKENPQSKNKNDFKQVEHSISKKIRHHHDKISKTLWIKLCKKVIEKHDFGLDYKKTITALKKINSDSPFYNDLKTKSENSKNCFITASQELENIFALMEQEIRKAQQEETNKEVLDVLVAMEGKYDHPSSKSTDSTHGIKKHEEEQTEEYILIKDKKYQIVN